MLLKNDDKTENPVSLFSLSKEQTLLLKGIAILMVILGHMSYITWGGAGGVTIFLILSGYGIHESFKKNGLKNYWKKKILKVWLPYVIVTIFVLIGKRASNTKQIIFSLIGLDFGVIADRSMWYISFIMLWYLGYYIASVISARFGKASNIILILSISMFSLIFMFFEKIGVWPEARGATVYLFAFPLGVALNCIGNIYVNKKTQVLIWSMVLLLSSAYLYSVYTNMYGRRMSLAWGLNALSIVVLINFSGMINKVLLWLGNHSYQMYLFELILLDRYGWFDKFNSKFLADISILFTVCVMSVIYKKTYDSIISFQK